jgi:hypothetical protein
LASLSLIDINCQRANDALRCKRSHQKKILGSYQMSSFTVRLIAGLLQYGINCKNRRLRNQDSVVAPSKAAEAKPRDYY